MPFSRRSVSYCSRGFRMLVLAEHDVTPQIAQYGYQGDARTSNMLAQWRMDRLSDSEKYKVRWLTSGLRSCVPRPWPRPLVNFGRGASSRLAPSLVSRTGGGCQRREAKSHRTSVSRSLDRLGNQAVSISSL